MKKSLLSFLVLILCIQIQTRAQIDSTFQGELSDFIIEQHPHYYLKYIHSKELNDGLKAHFFIYRNKDDKWPYGSGFEIIHPENDNPIWYLKMNGDFGLHSLQQIDINADGKMDLFFYAGFEDVFSTYIYTANYGTLSGNGYDSNNFAKAYANKNDYSVLLNFDNQSRPIIIDSGYDGDEKRSGMSCFSNQSDLAVRSENKLILSDSVKQEITKKYEEVTGLLDQYNFDYNMPEVYSIFNTKILDPIKLYKIEDNESVEVTSEYPTYLKWRIDLLKTIQSESSENCMDNIQSTIKHLESYL
ncbi:hypothetical protein G3570_09455 [Balneolaceae bacterium YR4-1]|uniref:VCBS repeat-containing protein n=1 Tax=Halalkalibaculum roseum TaxID=2709311 RepID=A0A6M1SX96_9BACT|nr:hypothetical protein [Halalkalibaculum roseum]NGP76858.1 hypothetical protein [Halalkalibaculum roseum]